MLRRTVITTALMALGVFGMGATSASAAPSRSYLVGDGPYWGTDPPTYSCLEACALLFGGSASNYSCSTNGSTIDHQAFVSGYGDGTFCTTPVSETFKTNTHYNCGMVGCSYSAYVLDYCESGETNFCFSSSNPASAPALSPVPLAGLGVLLLGVGGIGLTRKRTRVTP